MTVQELNAAVITINKIIASNNPVAAVTSLKKYGYQNQFNVVPAADIEKALLELYTANPSAYFQVIQEVPYRDTITNWTTSPETKQNISNIANQLGISQNQSSTAKGSFNFGDIWHSIVTSIGGSSTTNPNVITTTSQSLLSTTWIIILSAIGFGAIIFILWDAGVFKKGATA